MTKIATIGLLLAAACFGLAAREALAQPTPLGPNFVIENPPNHIGPPPQFWNMPMYPSDGGIMYGAQRGGLTVIGDGAIGTKEILSVSCTTGKVTLHGKPWARDPAMVKALQLAANCPQQGAKR